MKKKYFIIGLFLSIFATFFFASNAFAACPSTPLPSLGIDTGSASSLAGLIVHTKNNGTSFNKSVTISNGGVVHVTSTYAQGTGENPYTASTGSTYYIASQSTACSDTGYLWLGYGSSTAYGNAHALDCKNSSGSYYTFTVTVAALDAGGHWDYSLSGAHSGNTGSVSLGEGDNNITFQAANGYTALLTFNWVSNIRPTITPISPANGTHFNGNDTTSSVQLQARATDANADDVSFRAAYKKSTDGGATYGSWVYLPSSTTYSGPFVQGTSTRNVGSAMSPSTLGEGVYWWVVMSIDEHGLTSLPAGSTNAYTHGTPFLFYVDQPVVQYTLTMTVNPAGAGTTTPAVGTHPYNDSEYVPLTATATPGSGYEFDHWSNCGTSTSASAATTMTSSKTCTANFSRVILTYPADGAVFTASTYNQPTSVTMNAQFTDMDNESLILYTRRWLQVGSCSTSTVTEYNTGWLNPVDYSLESSWTQSLTPGRTYCWQAYGYDAGTPTNPVWSPIRTFTVNQPATACSISFSVNPIEAGQTSVMSWNATGAASAVITGPSAYSYTVPSLNSNLSGVYTAGLYRLQPKDYNGANMTSCTNTLNLKTLSCRVSPVSGQTPFTVRAYATGSFVNPPYEFDFNGDNVTDKTSNVSGDTGLVYYTYTTAGPYTVRVKRTGFDNDEWNLCINGNVTVTDPQSSTGGEVAP